MTIINRQMYLTHEMDRALYLKSLGYANQILMIQNLKRMLDNGYIPILPPDQQWDHTVGVCNCESCWRFYLENEASFEWF